MPENTPFELANPGDPALTQAPTVVGSDQDWQETAIAPAQTGQFTADEDFEREEGLHSIGEVVGDRYRLIRVLGQGGSGITYEAEDKETDARVALKVISLRSLDEWKQLELFEREVQTLKQLDHPQIPKYLDMFQMDTPSDRRFYIVQQLVEGTSLAELVKQGWRTNEAGICQIATQVLQILTYLQQFTPPIIHRDITPQNLIRQPDGTIFLVDFGAAKTVYSSVSSVGSTLVGTHGYMAPEQFRGQAFPTTDLFGLGATLLLLLTHRHPAELPHDGLKVRFRSRLQVSNHFADWLENLLAPEASDRLSSAAAALNALERQQTAIKRKSSTLRWIAAIFSVVAIGSVSFVSYQYRWQILKALGIGAPGVCKALENGDYTALTNYIQQGGSPTKSYGVKQERLEKEILRFLEGV
jgi:serine/threonine protein kinase